MADINSIGFGQISITNNGTQPAQTSGKEVENQTPAVAPATTSVDANTVLDYLNNSAILAKVNVKSSPNAMVTKYNSPEAVARIGAMMGDFEAGVIAGLAKFEEEMGAVPAYQNLSEADKMALSAELLASDTV